MFVYIYFCLIWCARERKKRPLDSFFIRVDRRKELLYFLHLHRRIYIFLFSQVACFKSLKGEEIYRRTKWRPLVMVMMMMMHLLFFFSEGMHRYNVLYIFNRERRSDVQKRKNREDKVCFLTLFLPSSLSLSVSHFEKIK